MTDATLFVGGRVFTGRRYAEALLVEGGRVLAVGPDASVRRVAATGADRVDLDHRLVVPGLADAHVHLGDLTRARAGFDAGPATSIRHLAEGLARWADAHPRWPIVGHGLAPDTLAERRWPSVEELDAVAPGRPIVLFHASGHAAVANTDALLRASGPDGPRPPDDTSTGVLVEEQLGPLRPLVEEGLPLTTEAMDTTLRELVGLGLTAVGTMNTGVEELSVLHDLDVDGRLPVRVHAYPPLGEEFGARPRGPPGRLAVVGVKAFLDGAFGPRTASLDEAYADAPATHGVDRADDATLGEDLRTARGRGLAPALHAIGDRAVARAVRLLSTLPRDRPPSRIEHASLTPPKLLGPLRDLGACLVVQPGFLLSDVWLRDRLGSARARWAYAFRTLSDLGIRLAGSSDAPYDLLDPWRSMRAVVRREDELGRSANPSPDQALSELEALALYTSNAHRAIGDEEGGGLEPDGRADLVVLSGPRLGDAILRGGSAVGQTWVEGRPAPGGRGRSGQQT